MFSKPRTRALSRSRRITALEPLEERTLLTATGWGGFDPIPDVNVYAVESSEIKVDFSGNTDLDLAAAGDMNGDGINDLVTVDSADTAPVISVSLGTGAGIYASPITTELGTISGLAPAGFLADFTGDGVLDYVSVAQNASDGSTLDINLFTYSGGVFSQVASSSISLSVFGNYSVYAITSIRLGAIGTDLAVQIENSFGFDSSGGSHSIDGVAVCTGNGEGTFSSPTRVTAFTGTLAGSVTLEGIDYLVSLNKGARTFGFWYYNAAKTAWSNAGGFSYSSEVGNIAIVSTAASGMRLWFSGNMNGSTHIGEFSLALSAGKVVLGSSQVYTIERTYTTQTVLFGGDLNADGISDLMLADSDHYTILFGQVGGTYGEGETIVVQTDYLTTAVTDIGGDGTDEILAVGGVGIWGISLDDMQAAPVRYAMFDTAATAAVTGDFDGDGITEVAVIESTGNRIAIYDYAAGVYQKVRFIEAPTQTVDGVTVVASAVFLATGNFTVDSYDQLLVAYAWSTDDGDTILLYDVNNGTTAARFNLEDGKTITATAAGRITSAAYDDVVAAVSDGADSSVILWGNDGGSLYRKAEVALVGTDEISITAVAIGDLDGKGRGDILLLDEGSGSGARLGWLTSTSSTFTASGLGWGNRVAASGTCSGLLLAEITGDGHLDAVTTRTYTDSEGIERAVIYVAEGTGSSSAPMGVLTPCTLGGDASTGIVFDGGTLVGPSITSYTDNQTGLGNLILAKGRTAARLRSMEAGTGAGGFLYLVRASSSSTPTAILSDLGSLGPDYYTWVDEWSSFYVEIWGNADGEELNRFQTTLSFDPDLFTAVSVGSGTGYRTESSVGVFSCTVSGVADSAVAPAPGTGKYVFLARVLFTASETGGVAIPIDGVFAVNDADFGVNDESINGSVSCENSNASALTELELFSVRFDSNDDGKIDVADFTLFANNYGLGTAVKPFKSAKAEIFNVVAGSGLNVQDFTYFANAYGMTRAKTISDRFYDVLGHDPTAWIPAAAELPATPVQTVVADTFVFFIVDESDEYEWFDFDAWKE